MKIFQIFAEVHEMGKPAARVGDMHVCPMVTGLVPHVGGPVVPPGDPTVLISGLPAARLGDLAVCAGPHDVIAKASATVLIGGKPAARMGDATAHGGFIAIGFPAVLIGDDGPGVGITTGLGQEVDDLLAYSPTLQQDILVLQNGHWVIKFGEPGKGSFCDKNVKTIVIDPTHSNSEEIVRTLAHEAGHALFTQEYPTPLHISKKEYVQTWVDKALKDEGEATLVNCQVREEIENAGGPDIQISGTNENKYNDIYKLSSTETDRDNLRSKIGEIFAEHERPSTDPSLNYRQYYSSHAEHDYDLWNNW